MSAAAAALRRKTLAYAKSVTRDQEHAQDLTQEAWLSALVAGVHEPSAAYLRAAIRTRWISRLRRAARARDREAPLPEAGVPAPAPVDSGVVDLCRRALELLAPADAQVLAAVAVGREVTDIAAADGRKPGAVYVHISRARIAARRARADLQRGT